jgi:integrase
MSKQAGPEASASPRSHRSPGLKIALPADPLRCCAFCETPRQNRTRDWARIVDATGEHRGWTCPECPTYGEPIRKVVTRKGLVRWRWGVSVTPEGSAKPVQASGTANTLAEAREASQAARDRIRAEGQWSRPAALSVAVLAERWAAVQQKRVKAGQIRQITASGYVSALDAPLFHLGHRPADQVKIGEIRDLVDTLATVGGKTGRPLSSTSIAYSLMALRKAYEWGIEQEWIEANPVAGVRAPKRTTEPKRTIWTTAELLAFRSTIDTVYGSGSVFDAEPWIRAGMRLTLCGLRRSEVLGLDWSAVDLAAGTVSVVASRVKTGIKTETALGGPKTDRSKRVVAVEDLHAGTTAALRQLWFAQGRPKSGLVVRDSTGRPVNPDLYSRRFRAISTEAGVPDLGSIHRIRHTLASWGRDAGISERAMASLLGHDVVTHNSFYVTVDDDAAAVGARALGEVLAR